VKIKIAESSTRKLLPGRRA